MLTITEVTTPDQFARFVDFPWQVYAGNPNWVPPTKKDVRHLLDAEHHPFWQHARRALFLAEQDNRIVGRISAQVDDNYNRLWNEQLGSFGFFESFDDQAVAAALLDRAAGWVRKQGMTVLRGPMSPSSNDEWGTLIEGFDSPPVIMMPYNPDYYPRLFEAWGLKKAKDLLAFFKAASTPMTQRFVDLARKLHANKRITVRPINLKNLDSEMALFKDIYNASWEKNWGFSPMTEAELDLLAKNLKTVADPNMCLLAFYDGKPAGLSLTLPDLNQILIKFNGRLGPIEMLRFLFLRGKVKGSRALVFGTKAEYRRLGLPVLLLYETEDYVRRKGYQWCELSWNLEDNRLINDFDTEVGARVYKRYRVYEKPL